MTLKKIGLIGLITAISVLTAGIAMAAWPDVTACDASGTTKYLFNLNEDVYARGYTGTANDWIDIYVINDSSDYNIGDLLSDVSSDGKNTVQTDANGNIPLTKIWHATTIAGKYDVVVDLNQNGKLDSGDLIDDVLEIGFEAIPEFPSVALAIAITLGIGFIMYRRKVK